MPKTRNDIVNDPTTLSLLDLPEDMLRLIPAQCSDVTPTKIMVKLSNTSTTLYRLFQPTLEKQAAKKLLQHVLYGEIEPALNMIAANPKLLFIEAQGTDYALGYDGSRRIIIGSPYQAIIGAGDMALYHEVSVFIDQLTNGRSLAAQQFKQQFPQGIQPIESTYDFTSLVQAITAEQFVNGHISEQTETALIAFRNVFKPTATKTGKHFELQLLITAFEMYQQHFISWSTKQLSFYWQLVTGYLQRMVPTCDAQKFCQVLNYHDPKPLVRTLKLYDGYPYYPNYQEPTSGLGGSFGVYFGCLGADRENMPTGSTNSWGYTMLKDYAARKQQFLNDLHNEFTVQQTYKP